MGVASGKSIKLSTNNLPSYNQELEDENIQHVIEKFQTEAKTDPSQQILIGDKALKAAGLTKEYSDHYFKVAELGRGSDKKGPANAFFVRSGNPKIVTQPVAPKNGLFLSKSAGHGFFGTTIAYPIPPCTGRRQPDGSARPMHEKDEHHRHLNVKHPDHLNMTQINTTIHALIDRCSDDGDLKIEKYDEETGQLIIKYKSSSELKKEQKLSAPDDLIENYQYVLNVGKPGESTGLKSVAKLYAQADFNPEEGIPKEELDNEGRRKKPSFLDKLPEERYQALYDKSIPVYLREIGTDNIMPALAVADKPKTVNELITLFRQTPGYNDLSNKNKMEALIDKYKDTLNEINVNKAVYKGLLRLAPAEFITKAYANHENLLNLSNAILTGDDDGLAAGDSKYLINEIESFGKKNDSKIEKVIEEPEIEEVIDNDGIEASNAESEMNDALENAIAEEMAAAPPTKEFNTFKKNGDEFQEASALLQNSKIIYAKLQAMAEERYKSKIDEIKFRFQISQFAKENGSLNLNDSELENAYQKKISHLARTETTSIDAFLLNLDSPDGNPRQFEELFNTFQLERSGCINPLEFVTNQIRNYASRNEAGSELNTIASNIKFSSAFNQAIQEAEKLEKLNIGIKSQRKTAENNGSEVKIDSSQYLKNPVIRSKVLNNTVDRYIKKWEEEWLANHPGLDGFKSEEDKQLQLKQQGDIIKEHLTYHLILRFDYPSMRNDPIPHPQHNSFLNGTIQHGNDNHNPYGSDISGKCVVMINDEVYLFPSENHLARFLVEINFVAHRNFDLNVGWSMRPDPKSGIGWGHVYEQKRAVGDEMPPAIHNAYNSYKIIEDCEETLRSGNDESKHEAIQQLITLIHNHSKAIEFTNKHNSTHTEKKQFQVGDSAQSHMQKIDSSAVEQVKNYLQHVDETQLNSDRLSTKEFAVLNLLKSTEFVNSISIKQENTVAPTQRMQGARL